METSDDVEKIARALCKQSGDDPDRLIRQGNTSVAGWKIYKDKAAIILADVRNLQGKLREQNSANESSAPNPICADTDEYIDLCVGVSGWRHSDDSWIVEDDYRVSGEVWRVHKGDADPFPSRPHAHCIAGAKRFIGCKLHLGTAQLYRGTRPLGRFLNPRQFERLIDLIRPKFPGLVLPLAPAAE